MATRQESSPQDVVIVAARSEDETEIAESSRRDAIRDIRRDRRHFQLKRRSARTGRVAREESTPNSVGARASPLDVHGWSKSS